MHSHSTTGTVSSSPYIELHLKFPSLATGLETLILSISRITAVIFYASLDKICLDLSNDHLYVQLWETYHCLPLFCSHTQWLSLGFRLWSLNNQLWTEFGPLSLCGLQNKNGFYVVKWLKIFPKNTFHDIWKVYKIQILIFKIKFHWNTVILICTIYVLFYVCFHAIVAVLDSDHIIWKASYIYYLVLYRKILLILV